MFWILGLFPMPGTIDLVKSVQNVNKHFYLADDNGKQYLVMVTDEFMETRQLAKPIENLKKGKKFEIGEFRFWYSVAI